MKKSTVKDVVLAITYKCNSRCEMCNIWEMEDTSNLLRSEHIKNLPKSVEDINITGGEPFLSPDIVSFVVEIKKQLPKAKIIISSNGFATDLIINKTKEILKIDPRLGVAISIDGMDEVHKKIRGIENGFEKAKKTIEELHRLGVKNIKIAFTISDSNYAELKKVYNLSLVLGVEFTIAVVHSSDNYFQKENKIIDKEKIIQELEWLMREELSSVKPKRWARAFFIYGLLEYLKNKKRALPDYSGEKNIFIDPNGKIYPCDISSKEIGNLIVKDEEIKNIRDLSCANSWMICTARQAMKKHYAKVIFWIIKNKFLSK